MPNSEKTLNELVTTIREVIGEDWVQDMDIDNDTSFNDDLEMESIEFVVLAEKLQQQYGNDVNFIDWLSHKELDAFLSLKVGDLTGFIDSHKS